MLKKLGKKRFEGIKQFPIAYLLLVWMTYISSYGKGSTFLWKIILVSAIAFLISIYGPIRALHQKNTKTRKQRYSRGIQILALIVGVVCYLLLPKGIVAYVTTIQWGGTVFLLVIGIFVLLALLHRKDQKKIWNARSIVLQSVILGYVGGGIVLLGLTGAVESIRSLFNIYTTSSLSYFEIISSISMILVAGILVLNYYTWHVQNYGSEIGMNPIRKILGWYIFFPLAVIYLTIFGIYSIKILFTGVWPDGVIVSFSLGYIALAVCTGYLTYTGSEKKYSLLHTSILVSFFFVAIMMSGAILKRIVANGMTINRYFICASIGVVCLYALFGLLYPKKRYIIGALLVTVVGIIASYGPLSASNITLFAQKTKIEAILAKHNIYLPLGKESLKDLKGEDMEKVNESIHYLAQNYRTGIAKHGIISSEITCWEDWSCGDTVVKELGLPGYSVNRDYSSETFYFYGPMKTLDIQGYKKIGILEDEMIDTVSDLVLTYTRDEKKETLDFTPYIEEIYTLATENKGNMPFIIEEGNKKYIITRLTADKYEGKFKLSQWDQGYILEK